MATNTMRAAVMHHPGAPSVLKIETRPIPVPKAGEVLIRVRAFGLNRSEMYTRQGHSPNIQFPRILGIEATGTVAAAPDSTSLAPGDVVITYMGGMGRVFDGGYAEYTCVPARQVHKLPARAKELSWEVIGAMPEMMYTVYKSLFASLRIRAGEKLLIRGGTSSIGLAAAGLAKAKGLSVMATSRSKDRAGLMKKNGVDVTLIDDGEIAPKVKEVWPAGADKVLELVGTVTLADSLRCAKVGNDVTEPGVVCVTGITGNQWTLNGINPMELIPTGVNLTISALHDVVPPWEEYVNLLADGKMHLPIGQVLSLDQITEAHQMMEDSTAGGKIVVLP
jgi:NADPH:quinone reductase-like Zn-dependent oxidoreductase